MLTHKAWMSKDATDGVCGMFTQAGVTFQIVRQERRFPLEIESEIAMSCVAMTADARCNALPNMAETRFTVDEVRDMMANTGAYELPDQLKTLMSTIDACS